MVTLPIFILNMKYIDPNLALVMIFVLSCLGFIALPACTPTATVQHTAPQLDAVGEAVKKIVVEDCKPTKYTMKPIPQDVEIDIKGNAVKANDGGIELLREYVTARKLLK